jgi:hypothetical protein
MAHLSRPAQRISSQVTIQTQFILYLQNIAEQERGAMLEIG